MQTTNIKNSTLILHKSFTQFQSNEAEARHQSQEELSYWKVSQSNLKKTYQPTTKQTSDPKAHQLFIEQGKKLTELSREERKELPLKIFLNFLKFQTPK